MVVRFLAALLLTAATAMMPYVTDERAMYGAEGPPDRNWQPRELAGWPAAFLADDPNTSVIHRIGPEDMFRPGPFVATLAFWTVVSGFAIKLVRRTRRSRWTGGAGRT